MARYIIKRLLWMIPVLLGVLFIVFTISFLSPGDPVLMILGTDFTPEAYAAKTAELGLDKPFITQFINYLVNLTTKFDMGKSLLTNLSVSGEIANRLPVTLRLGILGVIGTLVLGIPFGLLSATKQYSILDYSTTTFALVLAAVPNFVVALLTILVFAVSLKWLPATGLGTWKSWILPVFSNSIAGVAVLMRMTRTSMLEVIRQDYIRTARAKGIPEGLVIRKHALKNALIPIVTVVGFQMTIILAGSVIVETIFAIPGIGTYMMSGIVGRDYNVINGCVLMMSWFICCMNLLVDVAYAFIDPRIKAQYISAQKKRKKLAKIQAKVSPEVV
jgi:peptide/nickel transport system permease protein